MDSLKQNLLVYQGAARKIKKTILQSRYRVAANANAELLGLYYGVGRYIYDNTRSGKCGTGAIEAISAQLQGELPGLHGFSPSNMKNMRIFYEQWVSALEANQQLPAADLDNDDEFAINRQLPTAELTESRIAAFLRVGFTHHREILRKWQSLEERWYYIFRCGRDALFPEAFALQRHGYQVASRDKK